MEEQVCRGVHHSIARVEELVSSIYDSLRPAAAAEGAVGGGGAAEADAQAEQPSPFGSKENKPQQGPGGTADKPGDAEHVADADSGGAAAGRTASAEPATAKKADGGAAGGGEQRSGRKAKTPKAPVSRSLLRTYIIEVWQGRRLSSWRPGFAVYGHSLPGLVWWCFSMSHVIGRRLSNVWWTAGCGARHLAVRGAHPAFALLSGMHALFIERAAECGATRPRACHQAGLGGQAAAAAALWPARRAAR